MRTTVLTGAAGAVIVLTCASAAIPVRPAAHSGRRSVVGAAFTPPRPCHGRADHVVGAPYATVSGLRRAGAVAVGYGGHVTWLSMRSPEREAGFGAALATGDFNGDHCADLAVAAPDAGAPRPGADGTGVVEVYYGSSDGLRPEATLGIRNLGHAPGTDRFGEALAIADLDHDGRDDLVVGSPGLAGGGGVGVFTRGLRSARLITQRTSWVAQRTSETDGFGSALAIGDFGLAGGGGRREIAVGAPGDGDEAAGAVTVLDPATRSSRHITQASPGIRGVPERYDKFGAALAAADLDDDGVDELAIGVPGEDRTTMAENYAVGAVHILHASGRDDVWELHRGVGYDRLGTALAAGDLNGDGTADLAAGATGSGVVQVLNGHRDAAPTRGALIRSPAGRIAQFGWSMVIRDRSLYVAAPGADGFGGAVYRFRGKTTTTLQTGSTGELLGYAVL